MVDASDIGSACRLLAEVADWSPSPFHLVADATAVLAQAGAPSPATAPPIAAALREVSAGREAALDRLDRPELEELDGLVPPSGAKALADRLHQENALPAWHRLPRLLASDPDRLERLVADCIALEGRYSDSWAQCVCEAQLGAMDARLSPPAPVQEEFRALTAPDAPEVVQVESLRARLRSEARRDASGCLPLLEQAVGEVGHDALEPAIEAVLGRVAELDREALAQYLRDHTYTLDERAAAFAASLWQWPEPQDADRLRELVDALEQDIEAGGLFPRELWIATFHLLSAAARLDLPEEACRIVRVAGPPEWTVLNATFAPCRKRASTGDAGARSFLDQVAKALSLAGAGKASLDVPPAPSWTALPAPLRIDYWRIRTLPGVPWWRPWDGGLP